MPLQTAMNGAVPALQPAFTLGRAHQGIKVAGYRRLELGGRRRGRSSIQPRDQPAGPHPRPCSPADQAAHRHPTAIGLGLQQEIGRSAAIDRQLLQRLPQSLLSQLGERGTAKAMPSRAARAMRPGRLSRVRPINRPRASGSQWGVPQPVKAGTNISSPALSTEGPTPRSPLRWGSTPSHRAAIAQRCRH